jgi:hypothetical protein
MRPPPCLRAAGATPAATRQRRVLPWRRRPRRRRCLRRHAAARAGRMPAAYCSDRLRRAGRGVAPRSGSGGERAVLENVTGHRGHASACARGGRCVRPRASVPPARRRRRPARGGCYRGGDAPVAEGACGAPPRPVPAGCRPHTVAPASGGPAGASRPGSAAAGGACDPRKRDRAPRPRLSLRPRWAMRPPPCLRAAGATPAATRRRRVLPRSGDAPSPKVLAAPRRGTVAAPTRRAGGRRSASQARGRGRS